MGGTNGGSLSSFETDRVCDSAGCPEDWTFPSSSPVNPPPVETEDTSLKAHTIDKSVMDFIVNSHCFTFLTTGPSDPIL